MQNIFSIINGKKAQLPKKEQLLGEYIIANPESVISSSIQKLSKDTGISTATIVRFCREIGTNGFGDLKLQLVAARSSASNNDYHEFDAGEGIAAIKNTMAARFKSVIEAREKQIAKKPAYEGDGYAPDGTLVYDTWICPCCGSRYEVDYDDYDYCPNCGQKVDLDWSDEE